jgi:type II secretory pathway pseudopilin PulG
MFISLPNFQKSCTDQLQARLKAVKVLLQTAHKELHEEYSLKGEITPGVEWFLDNFYLVEQSFGELNQDLPIGLQRRLSRDRIHFSKEYTKIHALALECLCDSENLLDIEQTIRTAKKYQSNDVLLMAEIWALPAMLRWVIIENLAEVVKRLWLTPDRRYIKNDSARTISSKLPLKGKPADKSVDCVSIEQREACFSSRKVTKARAEEASDNEQTVINCLRSLRTLSNQDWTAFFEEVSRVEEILRCDPANVYANMDFDTRDRYRKSIEKLAAAAGWNEIAVASKCISLANCGGKRESGQQTDDIGPVPSQHVGYYLMGQGRPLLEVALGYTLDWKTRLRNWGLKFSKIFYLGAIMFLTAAFSAALGWSMWQASGSPQTARHLIGFDSHHQCSHAANQSDKRTSRSP